MVVFPHANNQEMDEKLFLAYWSTWFAGPGSRGGLPFDGPVPRLNQAVRMETLIDGGRGHGLDALCRTIVSIPYRNAMHATNPFMEANEHLVTPEMALNPRTGRLVNGAKLTPFALDQIAILKQVGRLLADANAFLMAN
jgi:hypothetical protein